MKLSIRALKDTDFLYWKNYYETMENPKNVWDSANDKPVGLNKRAFLKHLKMRSKQRKEDRLYEFGVFDNKSENLVGFVSIMGILRSVTQSAYIGYTFHNQYWGKGYAKKSIALLIKIAFDELKLHRVEAGIEPYNRRSIMLVRSLGFRKEGLKKRAVLQRGKWQDLVMYSATCEDFGIKWKP